MVFSRDKDNTDTMLVAKIVYDENTIKTHFEGAKKEEYQDLIWKDIKEINKTMPTFKHIKQIIVTDEPMSKTTTQKIKRYEKIKKNK